MTVCVCVCVSSSDTKICFCAEETPAEAREDSGGAEAARSYCNEETAGVNR